jgi:hypothetical protein
MSGTHGRITYIACENEILTKSFLTNLAFCGMVLTYGIIAPPAITNVVTAEAGCTDFTL